MSCITKIESVFEKWGCCVFATFIFILLLLYFPRALSEDCNKFFRELLSTYATVAAILSGLLTAATSNFMTHSSNEIISLLKKHNFFLPIISYSSKAAVSNGVSAALSMIFILVLKFFPAWNFLFLICCIWGTCAAYGFVAFIRVSIIFHLSFKKTFELKNHE